MALFSECTDRYAQKLLDTADIVREAMLHQLTFPHGDPHLSDLATLLLVLVPIFLQVDAAIDCAIWKG
jgi:hypothetical protein